MSYFFYKPYVSVAQRRAKALKEMDKLRKKGKDIQPVELAGNKIASSFWGKGWCDHLESFSDYENRLPRGRTYVRNGSVCHLEIQAGKVQAIVSGSELYNVNIEIKPLAKPRWKDIQGKCRGQIGSMLELLQGKLSNNVMAVVSDRKDGLFPQPGEMKLKCSCPDWATMCKHVAAVFYGVGSRLDHRPELLFLLRGVNAEELIAAEVAIPTGRTAAKDALADGALADIFGIDLEPAEAPARQVKPSPKAKTPKAKPSKGKKAAFDPNAPTGKAIARLRKQAGMSKAEFARTVGVSAQSVERWEGIPGPVRLQARPLKALADMQRELSQE